MTKEEAEIVLLRAFLATGELPPEIEEVLARLIDVEDVPPVTAS